MKKILNGLTKAEIFIMIVTFIVMVCASFAQVVNRNFIKLSIGWFDELAIYCMMYMVLIGTEMGLRDGTQIAVTAVVDKFKGIPKRVIEIIAKVIVVLFSFMVFMGAVQLAGIQVRTGQISAALRIPMVIPYASLVISFGMITLVQLVTVITMIVDMIKNRGEEAES